MVKNPFRRRKKTEKVRVVSASDPTPKIIARRIQRREEQEAKQAKARAKREAAEAKRAEKAAKAAEKRAQREAKEAARAARKAAKNPNAKNVQRANKESREAVTAANRNAKAQAKRAKESAEAKAAKRESKSETSEAATAKREAQETPPQDIKPVVEAPATSIPIKAPKSGKFPRVAPVEKPQTPPRPRGDPIPVGGKVVTEFKAEGIAVPGQSPPFPGAAPPGYRSGPWSFNSAEGTILGTTVFAGKVELRDLLRLVTSQLGARQATAPAQKSPFVSDFRSVYGAWSWSYRVILRQDGGEIRILEQDGDSGGRRN